MDFPPPQILPNLFFFNFFQPARESPADCRLFALGALFSPALFRLFSLSGAPSPGWVGLSFAAARKDRANTAAYANGGDMR